MTVHTPIESRTRGIPRWALGLTGAMLLVGLALFATNLNGSNPPIFGGPKPSGGGLNAQTIIKASGCQACHGPDLAGQASFPSLHGVKNGPVSANLQQLGKDHPDNWDNLWIAGLALIFGGVAHGSLLAQAAPADQVNGLVFWFRLVVGAGLSLSALAAAIVALNVFLMYTAGRPAEYAIPSDAAPAAAGQ
jgi:hypothetical protein